MSVANLTRYSVAPCYKDMSYTADCVPDENGDYVKFEDAMEASSNSLKQLKAEIAALADEIVSDMDRGAKPYSHHRIVAILRQLSAVLADVVCNFALKSLIGVCHADTKCCYPNGRSGCKLLDELGAKRSMANSESRRTRSTDKQQAKCAMCKNGLSVLSW